MPKHAVATFALACLVLTSRLVAQAPAKTLRIEPIASPSEVITPGGTAWALLVGIGTYPAIEGGSISSLRAPTKDVDALYRFLTDPRKGGFKPENVRKLKDQDATKDTIGIELTDISNKAAENDLVLIYFSGHGFRPAGGDAGGAPAYLIPYLTHPRALIDPAGTCIDYSGLAQKIRAMRAKKVITVLDACHTGGVRPEGSKGVQHDVYSRFYEAWDQAQGRPLLLSSDASEVSWEESDGSVFTKFLLRGLEGEADQNGDAIVGFNEVATYLEREVPKYTRSNFPSVQTPTRRYEHGPVRGDIPLALDLSQYETIQQQRLYSARAEAIMLADLDPELEELSLRVARKARARQQMDAHEAALLNQLDRFVEGTVDTTDYVDRAQALMRRTRLPEDAVPVPSSASIAYPGIPRGTLVVVDNVPSSLPQKLPPGKHSIRLQRDGYEPVVMEPELRPGQTLTLLPAWRRLTPPSGTSIRALTAGVPRAQAFGASLAVPGLGQHLNGHHRRAIAYEAVILLAGTASVVASLSHHQKMDDYEAIRAQIEREAPQHVELTAEMRALANQQANAYGEAQSARKLALASQIVVGVLWAVNALDGLREPRRPLEAGVTISARPSRSFGTVATVSVPF